MPDKINYDNGSLFFWERWILSADAMLSKKLKSKSRLFSFVIGLILTPALLMLVVSFNVFSTYQMTSFFKTWIFGGWVYCTFQRIIESKQKNGSELSYSNYEFPDFDQDGWAKSRFIAHYFCWISQVFSYFFIGSVLGLLLSVLIYKVL